MEPSGGERAREIREEVSYHNLPGAGAFSIATPARPAPLPGAQYYKEVHAGQQFDVAVRYVLNRLSWHDTFVDVGAHVGTFALPAARKCRRVLALEPGLEAYVVLLRSAVRNRLKNLTALHCAAYDRPGAVTLSEMELHNLGLDETVPAIPLDDIFATHAVRRIAIVKLDIEGGELRALRGMERALAAGRIAEFVFEVNEGSCRAAGYTGDELLAFFVANGYRIFQFYHPDVLSPIEPGDFRELSCNNFLAVRTTGSHSHHGLRIKPVDREVVLAYALDHATSIHERYRTHIAEQIHRAPAWLTNNPQLMAAIAKLADDPSDSVRRAFEAGRA